MNQPKAPPTGKRHNKSVFFTLLVSFLFVFMIPVMIGSTVYLKAEQIMIENAYRSNSAMLEQINHVLNGKTQEIDYITRQIAFHPKQQLFMQKSGDSFTVRDQYQMIEFMKELTRYKTYNSLLRDMYVYFGNTDTILTPSMKTDSKTFYNEIYHYDDMTYDDYKNEILLGQHVKSYRRSQLKVSSNKRESILTYVQSLPFGVRGSAQGSLVMLINENQIRDLMSEMEGLHEGTIYILNSEKDILIGPPDHDEALAEIKKSVKGDEGEFLLNIKGEQRFVSYTSSAENGWLFISSFPKKVVLQQVYTIKKWSLVTVVGCLIIGSLLCVYLTRRHYNPIRSIVQLMVRGNMPIHNQKKNEISFIEESVLALYGKEHELEQRLASQLPIIRNDFLTRLVQGQVDTESITDEDLRFIDLSFTRASFTVVIMDIDDSTKFMKEDTEREWLLLRFIMLNVSNEILDGDGYALEWGKNRIIALLNMENDERLARELSVSFITRLIEVMKLRFRTQITVGVSGMHDGLHKIAECYDEAMMALSYKLVKGTDAILHFNDLKSLASDSYRFPLDLEVQLANYTKNGDSENMERLLDSVYEINFKQNQLSPEMGRWLFLDLQSTLLKLMESLRIDHKQIFQDVSDPVKFMLETSSSEQSFKSLKDWYIEVCGKLREEKTDHSSNQYQRIVLFIEEHYTDNNLSLTMIAEQMKLNPIYLSSFFKKHSGENITEFITRIRINQVKLLLSQDLTVQEIAMRVGYANNIVLTKVFKKIEGITPGKYREQLHNVKSGQF